MKKFVGIGCAALIVLAAGLTALLILGRGKTDEVFRAFYGPFVSGNGAEAYRKMDPRLQAEVDEAYFVTYSAGIPERLGKLKDVSVSSFQWHKDLSGTTCNGEATLTFEKGTAKASLKAASVGDDLRVTAFDITSDALKGYAPLPKDRAPYEAAAKKFFGEVCAGEAETAWSLCHESLQKEAGRERFFDIVRRVHGGWGPLVSLTSRGAIEKPEDQKLVLIFDIQAEQQKSVASCSFQWAGMKGVLTGFQLDYAGPMPGGR